MKKILLMSLCAMMSLVCNGQKVITDYEQNGYRCLSTEEFGHIKMSALDTNLAFGLAVFAGHDTTAVLKVRTYSYYTLRRPAMSRMLIKCVDGKTLELQTREAEESDRIGTFSKYSRMTEYSVTTSYTLESGDISSLCSGIVKIRQEIFHGVENYYEKIYKEKQAIRIGNKFMECAINLNKALQTRGGFEEGFEEGF